MRNAESVSMYQMAQTFGRLLFGELIAGDFQFGKPGLLPVTVDFVASSLFPLPLG